MGQAVLVVVARLMRVRLSSRRTGIRQARDRRNTQNNIKGDQRESKNAGGAEDRSRKLNALHMHIAALMRTGPIARHN